jgi:uncharacterized protein YabN with tetrapyrrole methylase and pyrophosphatase domain
MEACQILRACKHAYCLIDDLQTLDYLRTLCPNVVDLIYLYEPATSRPATYDKIAQVLVDAAMTDGPAALVTHGHPLFLVSASERILERAAHAGIDVQIIAGVSSFDTLISDLRIDLGYGFQAFDATTLILEDCPINTKLPCIIFQAANTMHLDPQFEAPTPAAVLAPLIEKLRKHYAGDHEISFVHSATRLLEQSEILSMKLSDDPSLETVELWKRPTIYINPE